MQETKIGFFPPIKSAKPLKDLLEEGIEKEKVEYDVKLETKRVQSSGETSWRRYFQSFIAWFPSRL